MACNPVPAATISDFTLAEYLELYEGEGIVTETILITRDFAHDALARNVINRPLSERHVNELLWDLLGGKWKLTHQGVAFNVKGELVDGQHRMEAVRSSGFTVLMRVTFNLEVGYAAPIDSGIRVRQPRDVLHITQREQAICNALNELIRPNRGRSSATLVSEALEEHKAGIAWAKQAFPYQRGTTASLIAAHAFAYPVAPRMVRAFAQQFLAHVGTNALEPAVALHRFLDRARAEGRPVMLAVLRCLEAYCKGESLARVTTTESGLRYFVEQRAAKGL